MTGSNRNFRGRSTIQHGRALSIQPENAGNRRTFDDVRVPPDNIGNKVETDPIAEFIHDSMGNSLEEEPTHLKSGVMARLSSARNQGRRRGHEASLFNRSARSKVSPSLLNEPEEYFARLKADFAKLLGAKTGLAFSFSMKPVLDGDRSWDQENNELEEINDLICQLLEANQIVAGVSLEQYQTIAHRFAVFFIKPEESDPARNKELIAALRQVISKHAIQNMKTQVNIFLVLANAQSVIEEHLFKIGAKKVLEKED